MRRLSFLILSLIVPMFAESQTQSRSPRPTDERLIARLETADLVIKGKVLELEVRPEDEFWIRAGIEGIDLRLGKILNKIDVYFPRKLEDVYPRFSVSQEGVFILRRRFNKPGYNALDKTDILPLEEAARVKKLIRRPKPKKSVSIRARRVNPLRGPYFS